VTAQGRHVVVVDGSNLATEGRTTPSLRQLDEAVRAYALEDPDAEIVVVVDASFEHRIDPSERDQLVDAELHGEVVSPPAGAIGRGDAFVLRIAERTGARVLSNDSFQEFHAEHPWLFEEGRLIGGKPVPGVGWIFTPRIPVRGPKSRQVTGKAKRRATEELSPTAKAAELAKAAKKVAARTVPAAVLPDGSKPKIGDVWKVEAPSQAGLAETKTKKTAKKAEPAAKAAPAKKVTAKKAEPAAKAAPAKKVTAKKAEPAAKAAEPAASTNGATVVVKAARSTAAHDPAVQEAIGQALVEVIAPPSRAGDGRDSEHGEKEATERGATPGRRRRRRATSPPPAVNEPLAFITFVAAYPLGGELEGEVVSYTSHGAMVDVDIPEGGVLHAYIPLTAMGSPPPTKAREVLKRKERRRFVLVGLDPARRVAELALPTLVGAHGPAG
jgi:hypothetical protein